MEFYLFINLGEGFGSRNGKKVGGASVRVIGRKETAGFEIESACEEDDGEILVIFRLWLRKGRIPGVQVGGGREVLSAQLGRLWWQWVLVGCRSAESLPTEMQIAIP